MLSNVALSLDLQTFAFVQRFKRKRFAMFDKLVGKTVRAQEWRMAANVNVASLCSSMRHSCRTGYRG